MRVCVDVYLRGSMRTNQVYASDCVLVSQQPFADMRPFHDHKNWITEWIRSKMVTPEDREKKLAAVLGKMKNGADEL